MGFLNVQSVLMYDSVNGVHNVYLQDENVTYVSANGITKKMDSVILEKKVKEFDAFIDKKDNISLLCKTGYNQLVLHEIHEGQNKRKVVGDRLKPGLEDVHVFGSNEDINVVYTLPDDKRRYNYYIMHSKYCDGEWKNFEVGKYTSQGLLNNEIKIYEGEEVYIGFIEYRDNKSYFRVRRYDGNNWSKDILRAEKEEEVYWYDFQKKGDWLEFVYASKADEQFLIQYTAYDLEGNRLFQQELSHPSNNMHPIFVSYRSEQYIAWVEMDYVLSCKISSDRHRIEGPYKWKDSKNSDFMMYKFCYNNEKIKNKLLLQCGRVFGSFPSYSLLGFGNMKNNVEAVDIKKNVDIGGDHMEQEKKQCADEDKKVQAAEVKEMSISEKVDNIEKRLENIENYFKRKQRNTLFGPRR